jgi:hypothetical protein
MENAARHSQISCKFAKKCCPNGVPSEEEKRGFFLKEEGKKKLVTMESRTYW